MTRLEAAIAELAAALLDELRAEAPPAAPDRLLSVDEAGAALGLGRSVVYGLIGSGDLRTVKVGRRRLVPASAIAEFIAATDTAAAGYPSAGARSSRPPLRPRSDGPDGAVGASHGTSS